MADTFNILNCSKNLSLMSASALSSVHWLDLTCDGTDTNLTGDDSRKLADDQTNNAFNLIKDVFSEQIVVPACKKAFDKNWKNAPNGSSSNPGCGWIIEENNMFQQGSHASAAFELPVVHPLHASTSQEPPRSAPTINRTRSAPTTYNQIHRVSQPSRQPSQLSLLNPCVPPEALRDLVQHDGWLVIPPNTKPHKDLVQHDRWLVIPPNAKMHKNLVQHDRWLAMHPNTKLHIISPDMFVLTYHLRPPLPPVTTVLVESETESDSSLSPEEAENRLHGRAANSITSLVSHVVLSNAPVVLNCQACSQSHHHVVTISHPLLNSPPPAYRLEAATPPTLLQEIQGAPGRYMVTIGGMAHVVPNSLRNLEGNGA
ncbi:hypothetical protein BDR04DRAFT_1152600 [Suillus decipiens]|nr:hypothetical protein BDR04DRAFT_1152600 [Suillus decipiens]